ncbi:MAG: tRNA uridine-5-carboxymethylaminomethyl(34) synthesis GTPase MnmE [Ferruginibacter sp.]
MSNKLSGWDDTIVALATPAGIGAIGVIRLSGSGAFTIATSIFPSKDLVKQLTHTIHVGIIRDGNEDIDEAVVSLFKGPRSYTGEDVIEISCHGSPYVQQQIIQACISHGARLAKAGEFTQRAFLNGKLDLTQAEAVADLIASNTKASQRTALHNVRGGFSDVLKQLREDLIQFSALIELELDFATEDVEFADRKKFYELINHAEITTQQLLNSFQLGNVIKNGVSVAIIGKPNAGKSTLLNALLNEERAIVSEIAGTTRDSIEETVNINGILFRLIDTAGIRDSKSDIIEDIGMARSKANAERADIIIHLIDMTDESREAISWLKSYEHKTLDVHNKYDKWIRRLSKEGIVVDLAAGTYIAAKNKDGLHQLKELLYNKAVSSDINTENTIVTNARHYSALQQVDASLGDIKSGLDTNVPGDLLALDIRRCLHYISEITGDISNEDVLDFIFSKFCIGK